MAISKGKVAGVVLVSGLAAAAPLGAVGTASATCIGLSGIDIGAGCTTSLGSFALGIGPGTVAIAKGFINGAIATGTDTFASAEGSLNFVTAGGEGTVAEAIGSLNSAIAGVGFEGVLGVGTNVYARAGATAADFLNFAVNFGSAEEGVINEADASYGAVNLAGNLLGRANQGTNMIVYAGGSDEDSPGYGTVAANISGNRNYVSAIGTLNNATNWGNEFTFPNGSDSIVTAGEPGSPSTLSWAFNVQHVFTETCDSNCGNTVTAGPDPFAVAGAIGVVNQVVEQSEAGITIRTRLNSPAETNVLAAGGARRSLVRPSANFTPGLTATSQVGKVSSQAGSTLGSVVDQITASTKKLNDQVATSTKKLNDQVAASVKKINDQITTSVKKVSNDVKRGLSAGTKADPGKKKDSND